jgi:hypothetical protein
MAEDDFADEKRSTREQGLPEELTELLPPRLERALNHPLRRQILRLLNRDKNGGLSAIDLASAVKPTTGATQLNYHAGVLETCDLIRVVDADGPSSGTGRRYASTASRDVQIVAVLAATERIDSGEE